MTIKEQLEGTTWFLKSFESDDEEKHHYYPLGEKAQGFILFDHTGLFTVQLMADESTKSEEFRKNIILNDGSAEKRMLHLGYHAYAGTYEVDEDKAIMTTTVQLSLVEDYRGSKQQRSVKLDGDLLYLSNVQHPERKLVWERKR